MLMWSCYWNKKCICHKIEWIKQCRNLYVLMQNGTLTQLTVTDQNSQVLIYCKFSVIRLRLCSSYMQLYLKFLQYSL